MAVPGWNTDPWGPEVLLPTDLHSFPGGPGSPLQTKVAGIQMRVREGEAQGGGRHQGWALSDRRMELKQRKGEWGAGC